MVAVHIREIKNIFFLKNKVNEMRTRRSDALKGLEDLAEELKKSQEFSSGKTLEDDIGRTLTLANTDGSKPWLPELNEWIEAIKSKVRRQLIIY